jgi:hypothetical protein
MAEAAPALVATVQRGPDILVRTAPPLSATSDTPLAAIAKPPESASNHADDHAAGVPTEMSPEDQAAARTARTDPGPADDDKASDKTATAATETDAEIDKITVDGKDVPLPPWMKREITKARNRQRDAETAAKTAADELAAIRATVEELKAKMAAPELPVEPAADPRPTRDKFEDPESYDEALTAWAEREGGRKVAAKVAQDKAEAEAALAEQGAKAQQEAVDAELARLNTIWTEKVARATEKYPDYAAVAQADDLKISIPMAHAIVELDNGTDVAYHLGRNPEEAARIFALNPTAQAVQVALLSARLATPQPRTRARPLEPIDTAANAPSDTSAREESMDEVAARVNRGYAAIRRPFLAASPGPTMRH